MAATVLLFITRDDKEHMKHALELHSAAGPTNYDAMTPSLARLIQDREAWIANYLQEFRSDVNYPLYSENVVKKHWEVIKFYTILG